MTLSLDAHLSAAITSSFDGEDRISALPDTLLHSVVSHLPSRAPPAAAQQRHPLRPRQRPPPPSWSRPPLVSRVLASHPGPFRAVRIAEIPIDGSSEDDFPRARGVAPPRPTRRGGLTLGNRPFSFGVLVRHRDPPPSGLAPPPLPHPKLETLALISNYGYPDRVRVGNRRLRCVLLWHSLADEVAVVSAPSLQRLIIYCTHTSEADGVIKVKIGHAPQRIVLGYLDTATHQLEIGNTIIKAGVKNVCPNTVLPSVKVLALKV
ncbi:hypothetical protein ZWY2020_059610 [Hordeum vulgare]|nr:hypothetical protein ZWY2020_059610 [Hordeum vulgare]